MAVVVIFMTTAIFLAGCASPVIAPPDYARGRSLLAKAEEHHKAGEYQAALDLYREFLAKNPASPEVAEVKFRCGELYERLKRPEDAIRFYREVFYSHPYYEKRPETGLRLAYTQTDIKLNQDAIKTLNELLGLRPKVSLELEALKLLSKNYEALKEYGHSAKYAIQALISSPEEYTKSKPHIEELIRRTKPEELMGLKDVLSKGRFPELNLVMIEALYKAGDIKSAKLLSEELLETNPPPPVRERLYQLFSPTVPPKQAAHKTGHKPSNIGLLLPVTGPFSELAREVLTGTQLALEDLKREKGLEITEPKLIVFDTKGEEELVKKGLENLVSQEGVDLVIGPLGGNSAIIIKEGLQGLSKRVPTYVFTQKRDVADPSNGIFCSLISPLDQLEVLVQRAIEDLHIRNYAVIYTDNSASKAMSQRFVDTVLKRGGSVKSETLISLDSPDLAPFLEALRQAEAVFIPDTLNSVGIVLSNLVEHGINNRVLLSIDIYNPRDLMGILKNTNYKALIATSVYTHDIPDHEPVSGLEGRFFEATGKFPSLLGVSGYLTMSAILKGTKGEKGDLGAYFDEGGCLRAKTNLFWVSEKGILKID